jgi:uncharacterized integral membrane protein (TIGR00697 family)
MGRLLQTLIAMASVMIVIANIIAAKIVTFSVPVVGEVSASAGVVPIAVVFLCTDIISERYGKETAKNAVMTFTGLLALSWGVLQLSVAAPHGGGVPQTAYQSTISSSTSLFFASVTSVFLTQIFDVELFHRIYDVTDGSYRWVRNVFSTAISQLADTSLFTVLAFVVFPTVLDGNVLPLSVVVSIIAVEYLVRLSIAVVDTPIFYALTEDASTGVQADV